MAPWWHQRVTATQTLYLVIRIVVSGSGALRILHWKGLLHDALNPAVRSGYGMKDEDDPLAFLLRLNLEPADVEAKGGKIRGTRPAPSLLSHRQ